MNHLQTQSLDVSDNQIKQEKTQRYRQNPRKAATKLKQVNNNVEIMKKRFKVLQVQDDYNRYKTIDHQKRINLHVDLHQKLIKDRQYLKKSLEKIKDTTQVKQQAQQIRQEIKQKIKEARKNLINDRIQRYSSIAQQFTENIKTIREHKEKDIDQNRQKSTSIKFQQQKKRQSVSRHFQQKVKSIKLNKSIDSTSLARKAEKGEEQLSRLMLYEQELIKKSSESLQASQLMRHKFNEVFTTISSSNTSRLLPQIRAKTNNSKYTGDGSSTQV